ncbi:lysophospholipase [Roseiconus nitratireducens]|uniref:Lysophospholipase n=1 Tax=Roseiconus nitratireducens TaxID=2605748 RepID=A0A5M6D9G1_9BACT|nr:alpha/beta hydrolase [Roseiconus nitratireducens]KAA5542579.1 lysophospholipase [Roseiconus nitratireducens]
MKVLPNDVIETPDGRGLHCRTWGDSDSDRVFVVVHGLGEHSGYYADFGARMAEHGYATFAYDQHGHGKSPGRRGDAPSFQTLVDDISVAFDVARQRWKRSRLAALGHSMGANLLLRNLIERDDSQVDCAVVTNPMILPPDPPTKPQAFAAWLTGKLIPHFRLSASIEPTELTQDTDVLQDLADDPLVHNQLALGIAGPLVSSGHWLLENADRLRTRVLMLIGEEDELCHAASNQQFADAAGETCRRQVFAGLRHNLLLEEERDQVYQTLLDWIQHTNPT